MTIANVPADIGSAWVRKLLKDRFALAAMSIPMGLPKTVEAEPMFVAKTDEMMRAVGLIFKAAHKLRMIDTIMIIDVASPIRAEKTAESTISIINNFVPEILRRLRRYFVR